VAAARDAQGKLRPSKADEAKTLRELEREVAAQDRIDAAEIRAEKAAAKKKAAAEKKAAADKSRAEIKARKDEEASFARDAREAAAEKVREEKRIVADLKRQGKMEEAALREETRLGETTERVRAGDDKAREARNKSATKAAEKMAAWKARGGGEPTKAKAASAAKRWYDEITQNAIKGAVDGVKKSLMKQLGDAVKGKLLPGR